MNCRRFAVALLAPVILVHAEQAVKANDPTSRPTTATATILTTTRNDTAMPQTASRDRMQRRSVVRKQIDRNGYVGNGRPDDLREIVIIDLP